MKGQNRFFKRGILNHTYQRAISRDVIFYNVSDHLVFFTIFCTAAPKHKVRVLKLCQMPDHIHGSVIADRKEDLSAFVQEYTSGFSREHNRTCHREGPFFQSPFGSAPKYGEKKVRSNLIYVDNNPVERRLCEKAEQYRWNYLAYAACKHPFSEPFQKEDASREMLRAVRLVKARHREGRFLPYAMLQGMFKALNRKEQAQLVDIIIGLYSVIDHASAISYFGDYEQVLIADHATAGSEHDLKEVHVGKDDRWYARFAHIILDQVRPADIHDVLAYSPARKNELFFLLQRETCAPAEQIAAFLRL